ncbi:aspartyl-phosphate phosphatase Spo0E family protein, partial [Ruminiclostridium cellobioparum]|uniref:aspartyl-phosphate phosphatase Spo0E family protein n=1 Tax=Ruminiclostridium cellobioparum TaxID=29355 RepID=UPI0028B0E4CB
RGMELKKNDIEKLREKLNSLILENSDYSEILKKSEELDDHIAEFTKLQLKKGKDIKQTEQGNKNN